MRLHAHAARQGQPHEEDYGYDFENQQPRPLRGTGGAHTRESQQAPGARPARPRAGSQQRHRVEDFLKELKKKTLDTGGENDVPIPVT